MPDPSSAPVLFDTYETASGHRRGRATLNAPASLNALSLSMIDLLDPQLQRWATDPQIAGVLLDATGDKAFCAGGDVVALAKAIIALHASQPGAVLPEAAAFFEHEYRLDHRIHTYPKPLAVWGHGIVMGGGIGLLAGASHRIVTPATRLAMPEITIGLYPDVGGSWILPRLPGRSGLFLALTGASINGSDARFAGLADFALPHDAHGALLDGLAAATWQGDAQADAAQLSHLLERLGQGAAMPDGVLRPHLERINTVIGHDRLSDIAPRLRALADDADPWLAKAGAAFAAGAPSSAVLSFELQRRARHLSLADVFRLEYQISVACCAHTDFAEGVRALLIDKDKAPRWNPATLDAIGPDFLADHLRPRFEGAHPLADLG